jgi:hypothetical protein
MRAARCADAPICQGLGSSWAEITSTNVQDAPTHPWRGVARGGAGWATPLEKQSRALFLGGIHGFQLERAYRSNESRSLVREHRSAAKTKPKPEIARRVWRLRYGAWLPGTNASISSHRHSICTACLSIPANTAQDRPRQKCSGANTFIDPSSIHCAPPHVHRKTTNMG